MAIYLIRHGETAQNAARVVQLPEVPLSERGLDQARRLAARLAAEGIGRILASDLTRAAMTATALAEATGAPLEHDALLQERNFGDLRGRSYEAIGFDPDDADYEPPGGEGVPAFHARVDRAWQRVRALAEATPGNLAVVTHGLVCRALVARHWRLDPALGPLVPHWRNTSVTIAEPPEPWRVRLLGCTAHLGAELAPGGGPGSTGPGAV